MAPLLHSLYQHTAIEDDEIRLLILEPESPLGRNSTLRGQLETFVLTVEHSEYKKDTNTRDKSRSSANGTRSKDERNPEAPEYEALSYTWGGEDSTAAGYGNRLYISEFISSKQHQSGAIQPRGQKKERGFLELSRNLEEALRTFRAEIKPTGPPLVLWIDSICIWQDGNHHEKSAQIGKMADIYTEAANVKVWLGNGEEAFADVREFIKQILTLDKFDKIASATENASKWNALKNLMQSPWFQRRWIVQEIAFARQATVHWGPYVIPWNEFASAVQLFAFKGDTLRKMFQRAAEANHNPDHLGEVEAYGAKNLVDTIDKMLRKSEKDGSIMELLLSLETILTTMTAFETTKPQDTVYAIIQLSNDARAASGRSYVYEVDNISESERHSTDSRPSYPINFLLSRPDYRISESPERLSGPSKATQGDGSVVMSSADEWAEGDQRGRTYARNSATNVHLAVRNDNHLRSRSRGRSPAAAKTIAEKAYRKPRRKFLVDYDQSILKLCTEVIEFITDKSDSLDIICKPWAPELTLHDIDSSKHDEDKDPYPSWIQSLCKRAFMVRKFANDRKSVRVGADNLAGVQNGGVKTYSACGIVPPEIPKGVRLIEGRILNVRGFILDKIEKIAEPALNAIIPNRWLSLGWEDKRRAGIESLPPEQFWRTLVANRASSNGPTGPPLYWRQACQWAFSQQGKNGNLNTAELIHNLSNSDAVSKPVTEFLNRVRAVVWDRALIRTELETDDSSMGFLGLAPKEAQTGDLICILYGCSVPVVLRRKKRRGRSPGRPVDSQRLKRRRTIYGEDEGSRHSRAMSEDSYHSTTNRTPSSSGTNNSNDTDNGSKQSLNVQLTQLDLDDPCYEEYSLIGECYIHGMMDGEAFGQLEKFKLGEKEKTFRIGCTFDCTCRRCEPSMLSSVMEEDSR